MYQCVFKFLIQNIHGEFEDTNKECYNSRLIGITLDTQTHYFFHNFTAETMWTLCKRQSSDHLQHIFICVGWGNFIEHYNPYLPFELSWVEYTKLKKRGNQATTKRHDMWLCVCGAMVLWGLGNFDWRLVYALSMACLWQYNRKVSIQCIENEPFHELMSHYHICDMFEI